MRKNPMQHFQDVALTLRRGAKLRANQTPDESPIVHMLIVKLLVRPFR